VHRQINHGIIVSELIGPRDGTLDFSLDLLNQGSGIAVHWSGSSKSLESCAPSVPAAVNPVLPSGTGRSQVGSDPVNPVHL